MDKNFGWVQNIGHSIIESFEIEIEKKIYRCQKCLTIIDHKLATDSWRCTDIDNESGEICNSTTFTTTKEMETIYTRNDWERDKILNEIWNEVKIDN